MKHPIKVKFIGEEAIDAGIIISTNIKN